jgi:aspartate/methionine/tyrosine aminotransferase
MLEPFFRRHVDRFTWLAPAAGPIAFPLWKQGDVTSFCLDLRERAGVLLLPGTVYDPASSHFRIGFGRADLKQGLAHLEEYLRKRS